ncbi:integrase [Azospirillum sp. B510]|uniref:tyrosine-type recombinase/integrase n=1 Tax=Azospirillum sp. (strain B510) TaxID=137722 RepID=UPI0001C4C05D|nr:site-specific integrase [Azospirillum sp. B510]BAI71832.1 integrase [Azospirillum sp. B510]
MNIIPFRKTVQHQPASAPDRVELKNGRLVIHRRRGSGYWQMRARLPGEKDYVRVSLKTSREEEARELALREYIKLEMKIEEGIPIRSHKFGDAAKKYRKWLEDQLNIKATSADMTRNLLGALNRYVEPYFGAKDMSEFRHKAAEKLSEGYYHWRATNGKGKASVPAWKTVNFEYMAVNAVIEHAVKLNWIDDRNACKLKLPKFVATPTNRRPGFTEEEYLKLARYMWRRWVKVKDKRQVYTRQMVRHLILVMVNSGMRTNDIEFFRWRDMKEEVDQNGETHFMLYLQGKQGRSGSTPPAWCAAQPRTKVFLERWKEICVNIGDDDLVFSTKKGGKLEYSKIVEDLFREAGVLQDQNGKKRTLYSCRHTYAMLRLQAGASIGDIARNMRTSVAMIEKHYGQVQAIERAAAVTGPKLPRRTKQQTGASGGTTAGVDAAAG